MPKCHKKYIGETRNTILEGLKQHIYIITKNRHNREIVTHFQEHGLHNLKITGLEANSVWPAKQRKNERWWMQKVNTWVPMGLNETPTVSFIFLMITGSSPRVLITYKK